MTIEEWNQLQPGDYIRSIRSPDLIYKVTALEPDEEWPDKECGDKDDNGNELITIAHQIWTIDPLVLPGNPNYPDICDYDPGECDRFERAPSPDNSPNES
jgi:hypothetical protein